MLKKTLCNLTRSGLLLTSTLLMTKLLTKNNKNVKRGLRRGSSDLCAGKMHTSVEYALEHTAPLAQEDLSYVILCTIMGT